MEKWFIRFASPVSEVDHFLVPELGCSDVQSILEPSLTSMMRVIVLCVTIATISCQK